MPTYKYRAIDRDGQTVRGVIDAFDELAAIDTVKRTCPVIVEVRRVGKGESLLQKDIGPKQVELKQLAILCSQFSIVLAAGMPVAKAVELMAKQTGDKKLKKLLPLVAADVSEGYSLADSFQNKGADMLPTTFVETIRAGEDSGTLDQSFADLKRYYENQSRVLQSVRSAMMYPIFLLSLAAVVIAIVMGVAMPVFNDMFAGMNIELPGLTKAVLGTASFLQRNILIILVILLALGIALYALAGTPRGKRLRAKNRLSIPVIRDVVKMKAASQFANTMATLLSAGLPLIRCVQICARVLDNLYIGSCLGAIVPLLKEGQELGVSLQSVDGLPPLLVEMSAMGEQTGSLEGTLRAVSEHYNNEVNVATSRALSMLQPIITVLLGIIIGVIVVALYLPMFTLYGGIA